MVLGKSMALQRRCCVRVGLILCQIFTSLREEKREQMRRMQERLQAEQDRL